MVTYGFGMDSESIRAEELAIGLDLATLAEIKELIDYLDLPLKKSARKTVLVETVTTLLMAHPEYIVNKMTGSEIDVVKRLLAGEKIVGDSGVLHEFYLLVRSGWIALKEIKGCPFTCEMIMRDEAEQLLRPLLADMIPSLPARIMQLIDGWAALCGILPVGEIASFIGCQPGFEGVTSVDVTDALRKYARPHTVMYEMMFNSGEGDRIYITPWRNIVGNCGRLLYREIDKDGQKVKVNAFEPQKFDYQQIMDTSVFLFAPQTPNTSERKRLERICRKNGLDSYQIDELLLDAWIEKQTDQDTLSMQKFIDRFRLTSLDALNEVVSTITDYMNTVPFWRFLGHTSKEIAAKDLAQSNRPPRLVAGPNMRAMGMDIPAGLQEAIDKAWNQSAPAVNSSPKVGRNDPCPCGSGKKYKNCCGK